MFNVQIDKFGCSLKYSKTKMSSSKSSSIYDFLEAYKEIKGTKLKHGCKKASQKGYRGRKNWFMRMKMTNESKIKDVISQIQYIHESSVESAERYYSKSYHSSESSRVSLKEDPVVKNHQISPANFSPTVMKKMKRIQRTIRNKKEFRSVGRNYLRNNLTSSFLPNSQNTLSAQRALNYSSFKTKSQSPPQYRTHVFKSQRDQTFQPFLTPRVPLEELARSRVQNAIPSLRCSKRFSSSFSTKPKWSHNTKVSRIVRKNLKEPGTASITDTRFVPVNLQIQRKDNESNMALRILTKERKNKVKESDIPLDVLFNQELNDYKLEEARALQKPKPIVFRISQVKESKGKGMIGKVRFEIEGGGKPIDANFVRKNEIEFFEFVEGFNDNYVKSQTKKSSRISVAHRPRVSLVKKFSRIYTGMEFKLKLNRGVTFKNPKQSNENTISISEYSCDTDKSGPSSKSRASSLMKMRLSRKSIISRSSIKKINYKDSKKRILGSKRNTSFKNYKRNRQPSDDNSSQVSLDVVEEKSYISESESEDSQKTNSVMTNKDFEFPKAKLNSSILESNLLCPSPEIRKTPNLRTTSNKIKPVNQKKFRSRASMIPKKLQPRKTLIHRGSILKDFAMKNINIIRESSFDQSSSVSEMRSDAMASIARINEIYSPRSSIKKQKKNTRQKGIYLFDIEMQDKIIDATVDLSGLNRDHRFVKPSSETKQKNLCLASKQYGSKWFVPPKKWKQIFQKALLQEEANGNKSLKTNIALTNMIDRIKGVSKTRPVSPLSPPYIPEPAPKDASKIDVVKNFQEDISKLMEEQK
ncbi:unnamed protein product [Moneuplotes crassus]|uniref:Uncharacterized protein n=1 Tax=Euplotes crassus TaxID=5936 RepID=A0AAD2D203_EUPCR|nr:unnamed protein product [Moneuplotes crassus]